MKSCIRSACTVYVLLCVVVLTVADTSNNGCQCLSACEGSKVFGVVNPLSTKYCNVGNDCTDSENGKAECGGSMLDAVTDAVGNAVDGAVDGAVGTVGHAVDATGINNIDSKAFFEQTFKSLSSLPSDVSSWTDQMAEGVDPRQLSELTQGQIEQLKPTWVTTYITELLEGGMEVGDSMSSFTSTQLQSLSTEIMDKIQPKDWQKVNVEIVRSWSKDQWKKIGLSKELSLSAAQVAAVKPDVLRAFDPDYWAQSSLGHVSSYTAEQTNAVLDLLTTASIGALKVHQLSSLSELELALLTIEQLRSIDYEALTNKTKAWWSSLGTEKTLQLANKQLQAIHPDIVKQWSNEQWAKIPKDQYLFFDKQQISDAATLASLTAEQLSSMNLNELDITLLPEDMQLRLENAIKVRYNAATDTVKEWQSDAVGAMDQFVLSKNSFTTAKAQETLGQGTQEAIVVAEQKMESAQQSLMSAYKRLNLNFDFSNLGLTQTTANSQSSPVATSDVETPSTQDIKQPAYSAASSSFASFCIIFLSFLLLSLW